MKDFVDESSVMYWLGSPGPGDHAPRRTTRTHVTGPTNSTRFTNCCGVAVTERETRCPKCHAEVEP